MVLPYIDMNPPQVYTCSPSWTLLPPPSPYHSSGSSQCTNPKHPVSCIEPGLVTHFIYDIPSLIFIIPLPSRLQDLCWKPADNLIGTLLCITSCFSLVAFKILSLFVAFDDMIIMYLRIGLFRPISIGVPTWLSICLPGLGDFWLLFLQIASLPLSLLFCDSHNVHVVPLECVP